MPDWLAAAVAPEPGLSAELLAVRLVLGLACGVAVAGVYRASHGREHDASPNLAATLVLLSVLIAMVSLVIGNSVARAFSLVGALSIVRFRTVVDDTRDTAFVIFAVIVGMAAGTGVPLVAMIGIPIVGVAALFLSRSWDTLATNHAAESTLDIRLGLGRDPETALTEVFQQHLATRRLVSVSTVRQGAALNLSYRVRLRSSAGMTAFVTGLNQVEGVQSVELHGN